MPPPKAKKPVPHAIARALERYGLKLTPADLRAIAFKCAEGYGRLMFMSDGSEKHMVHFAGKTIVVIYKPRYDTTNLAEPYQAPGTIMTVLPKDAALAGNPFSIATRFKGMKKPDRKPPKKRRQSQGY